MKQSTITRDTTLFVALAVAGVVMSVISLSVADIRQAEILSGFGAGIFTAALTFFLVRVVGCSR